MSLSVLGVSREQVIIGEFETRKFPQQRQEVLDYLFQQRLDFKPDMVFVHTRSDIHQDHNVVTEEALASYKTYSDKYYFDPCLLRATMVRHGALAERPYAEGFDILRNVGMYQTSGVG